MANANDTELTAMSITPRPLPFAGMLSAWGFVFAKRMTMLEPNVS